MSEDFARSRLAAARALFDAGNLAGAERLLKEALAADPGLGAAHALLSFALGGRNRLRPALQAAEDALAVEPTAFAFRAKALALHRLKRRRAAVEAAEAAVRQAPGDPFAALTLGVTLEGARKPRAAEASFRRAVDLAPGDDRVRADLGRFLLRQRRLPEAEAVAASIDPASDFSAVLLLRGEVALRRRRPAEARDFALWLLSQDAANPSALRLLTQVKASQSPFLALWWRYALFMAMKPWWLRVLAIAPVVFCLSLLLPGFGLLPIAYLAVGGLVFARMVRRELKTVQLRKGF